CSEKTAKRPCPSLRRKFRPRLQRLRRNGNLCHLQMDMLMLFFVTTTMSSHPCPTTQHGQQVPELILMLPRQPILDLAGQLACITNSSVLIIPLAHPATFCFP